MDAQLALTRLGENLRTQRKARGLTQAELAVRAGLPRLKVVQVEAGSPTVAALAYAKVAGAMGVELAATPARRPTLDELPAFMA
jgi:HTH-type transcriptional regulator / antitoxin HipB